MLKDCLTFCPPQPFENKFIIPLLHFYLFSNPFPYSPKSHSLTYFLLPLEGRGLYSTVFTPEQLLVRFVRTTPKLSRRVPSVIYTGTLRLRHNCELGWLMDRDWYHAGLGQEIEVWAQGQAGRLRDHSMDDIIDIRGEGLSTYMLAAWLFDCRKGYGCWGGGGSSVIAPSPLSVKSLNSSLTGLCPFFRFWHLTSFCKRMLFEINRTEVLRYTQFVRGKIIRGCLHLQLASTGISNLKWSLQIGM